MQELNSLSIMISNYKEPQLTYALNHLGRMVSIDSVEKGLSCNCRCPKCNADLIAKHGSGVRHPHFAHKNDSDCQGANESALHRLAKQIIEEEKSVMVPKYLDIKEQRLSFVKVEIEKRDDRKDLQPDIVGITEDDLRWAIEIRNTHEVDDNKFVKLKESEITCLEIDVSDISLDDLKRFLLESVDCREWINNPNYDLQIEKRKEVLFKKYENNPNYMIRPKSDCYSSCDFNLYHDKCICLKEILSVGGIDYVVCNEEKKNKVEKKSESYSIEKRNHEEQPAFVSIFEMESQPLNIYTNENLPFDRSWNMDEYYNHLCSVRKYEYDEGLSAQVYVVSKTNCRIIFLYVEPKEVRTIYRYHISIISASNGQPYITKLDYMNMTSALADYDNRLREMKILEESQLSAEFDNNDLPF